MLPSRLGFGAGFGTRVAGGRKCFSGPPGTSLQVQVELFVEQMYTDERLLAVMGFFTFVAVGEHRRPTPLGRG